MEWDKRDRLKDLKDKIVNTYETKGTKRKAQMKECLILMYRRIFNAGIHSLCVADQI